MSEPLRCVGGRCRAIAFITAFVSSGWLTCCIRLRYTSDAVRSSISMPSPSSADVKTTGTWDMNRSRVRTALRVTRASRRVASGIRSHLLTTTTTLLNASRASPAMCRSWSVASSVASSSTNTTSERSMARTARSTL